MGQGWVRAREMVSTDHIVGRDLGIASGVEFGDLLPQFQTTLRAHADGEVCVIEVEGFGRGLGVGGEIDQLFETQSGSDTSSERDFNALLAFDPLERVWLAEGLLIRKVTAAYMRESKVVESRHVERIDGEW